MRITQGTFSFLPDFTDEQISAQVQYCLDNGWALNFEYTDDPHPRNTYWEMWGIPLFDIADAAGVMMERRPLGGGAGSSQADLIDCYLEGRKGDDDFDPIKLSADRCRQRSCD